jgi:molybdate/tungstate transport system substrate-binding protein
MDDGQPRLGRRSLLSALAAGLAASAGCVGARASPEPVSLLTAGSLNNAFENGLRPSTDARLELEARGSAELARLVAEGVKAPDIVSVSDVELFDGPLSPEWYAEFATNSVVLAYNGATDGGKRLADAGRDRWYEPLLADAVRLGRTDPALDPLGYRTLFTLELATAYYDTGANLRTAIPERRQLYPETQLVSQFETGSIDAAFTYRNMAVERDYDYIELPTAVDLSDPAFADEYATVSYELPGGKVVEGAPISYGSTIREASPDAMAVFEQQIRGEYLREFGFTVPEDYPRFRGDAPDELTH